MWLASRKLAANQKQSLKILDNIMILVQKFLSNQSPCDNKEDNTIKNMYLHRGT